jgi:hypothetical protein
VKAGYISAMRPQDVAQEVEALLRSGCASFMLRSIDHGGMLDQERLGAARYAAGVQSVVELELAVPAPAAAQRR